METKIAIFKGKEVRKVIHNDEWWFSIVDICFVLTESKDSGAYWRKLKQRLINEGSQVVTNCHGLKLEASDGKKYKTDCANTEGVFRIIQSIPSKKAEPFKRWLAKVGYERIKEIEDPELAVKRTRAMYRIKGYSDEWIERRIQGIKIREELTDEWHKRGVKENQEYAILTAEIHEAAFGIKPSDHKNFKGLEKENLRDHMTTLEHLFSQLGEESTKELAKTRDAQGYEQNLDVAKEGGQVAGRAREDLEKRTGKIVTSRANFKALSDKKKPDQIE